MFSFLHFTCFFFFFLKKQYYLFIYKVLFYIHGNYFLLKKVIILISLKLIICYRLKRVLFHLFKQINCNFAQTLKFILKRTFFYLLYAMTLNMLLHDFHIILTSLYYGYSDNILRDKEIIQ